MPNSIDDCVFPLPNDAGAIYEISLDQWNAFNSQAAVVVEARQIAQQIIKFIPNYPTLLPVCVKWRPKTYPALISNAVLVGVFAATVPPVLLKIQSDVAALPDTAPVPAGQLFMWRVQFEAFADHANVVNDNVVALAPDVASFVSENRQADISLGQIASSLPPEWQSIAGPLDTLSSGLTNLQGGWSSILSQLKALSNGSAHLATAGQVRAAVAMAIPAWNSLNSSAIAFDQHASNSRLIGTNR
ncbi:hypothetical protein BLL42_02430 [Pseudomonas frederiksbergensis]|uniref:Uncharacterized protein n=1 Tax=Pseudomonas frederiksbergensis TaxID=104087 RepID=A0A1J0EFD5_9PSED|nr:hypothetical protein [Pseudomonas frederiksbergensis]APC14643.1 hypothetical protein BLL42_02430 [Pseudomonas frederiksbergensis]